MSHERNSQTWNDRAKLFALHATPFTRAEASCPRKRPSEVALVGKATVQGNVAQRSGGFLQEILRFLHPPVLKPLIRCHAGRLTKRSGEVPSRKFAGAREGVQRDAPANVGIEELFGSTLLPGCETASHRRMRQPDRVGDRIARGRRPG